MNSNMQFYGYVIKGDKARRVYRTFADLPQTTGKSDSAYSFFSVFTAVGKEKNEIYVVPQEFVTCGRCTYMKERGEEYIRSEADISHFRIRMSEPVQLWAKRT